MKRLLALWILAVFFCSILTTFVPLAFAGRSEVQSGQMPDPTLTVPFYHQIKKYYCGQASLEMVFDYYGPDISQYEIADVSRAAPEYGAYPDDMRRAAHFSDLSTSVGTDAPDYTCTGYTGRGLGYAAFEYSPGTFWLNDLRTLIDAGYPIVVLTWYNATKQSGHYRVVVGYDSSKSEVIVHDPWNNATWGRDYGGPCIRFNYTMFQYLWSKNSYWGLFTAPWEVSVNAPASVGPGSTFSASASVKYPCPSPFSQSQYPASSAEATITLPTGFSLAPSETATKTLGTGNIAAGDSASVSWQVVAGDTQGSYDISVSAEGRISGNVGEHVPQYPAYSYTDRIGGVGEASTSVTQYYLTLTTNPQGITTPSGEGWYGAGAQAPISTAQYVDITPGASRFRFNGWTTADMTEIGDPSAISTTVLMDKTKTVTANYRTQYYITVISDHDSPTSSQWIDQGSSFTASVTSPADDSGAGTRYRCTGYKIDDESPQQGTSYTFTNVQAPHKIEFQWITQYRLVVSSARDSPNPSGTNWYDSGTQVSANVASPADDDGAGTRYKCTGWTGTGSVPATGTSTSVTFITNSPSSITWNWIPQYRITFTESGPETGRSVIITVNGNPHSGTTTYTYSEWFDKDSSVTFSITDPIDSATSGKKYVLVNWKNSAGSVISSPQTILSPNIFTANFKTQYYITVNSAYDPNHTPSQWVDVGSSLTVSVTSPTETVSGQTQWRCTGYSLDGGAAQAGTTYTFTNVQAAHTITFSWKQQFWIQVNSAHDSPTASQWVDQGGSLTASVTSPADDNLMGTRYRCTGYTLDSNSPLTDGSTNYTFNNIQSAHTITFNWTTQYRLIVSSAHGSPSPAGTNWYDTSTDIAASVTSPADQVGGTRYRCTGYTGTGSVPASGTAISVAFKITEPSSITWNWIAQYYLTVNTNPAGLDSPTGENWCDSGVTAHVSTAQYTSTVPGVSRYRFGSWTGASGTYTDATVVMDSAKTATANYQLQYFITVTSAHDSPTPSAWVDKGNDFTASVASPTEIVANDQQWICTGFSVDGGVLQAGTSYTFTNVQAAYTITFSWKQQFWIQVNSAHDSPTASQWVDKNNDVTASVTSPTEIVVGDHQWVCTGFSVDGGVAQVSTSFTFTNVQVKHTIVFSWKEQFWIQVNSVHDNPTQSGWVDQDSGFTASVTSPADIVVDAHQWVCTGFSVDGGIAQSGTSFTFTNIQAHHTVTFNWAQQFWLQVSTVISGSTVSGTGWYDSGASAQISATTPYKPPTNNQYLFTRWKSTGTNTAPIANPSSANTTVTMNNYYTVAADWQEQWYITVTSAYDNPTPSQWVNTGGSLTANVTSPAGDEGAGTRYRCTGYKVDDGSLQSGTSFTFTNVQAPHKIEFQWIARYRLVVNSAHDLPSPSSANWYDSGTQVSANVTSLADDDGAGIRYKCTGWTGTGSVLPTGTSTSVTFTITAPSSITWNWIPQYQINFTESGPEEGRSTAISVNGHSHSGTTPYTYSEWFDKDSSVTFGITDPIDSATSGKRYVLVSWKNSAGSVITSPQTISNPNTFTAYCQTQYYINVNSAHGGPTPSQWVNTGENLTTSVTSPADDDGAGTKYRCTGYKVDRGPLQTGLSYTFTNVQVTHTVAFEWIAQYRLKIDNGGHGITTPSSGNWYDSGTQVTIAINSDTNSNTTNTRYLFSSWRGTSSGSYSGSANPCQVQMNAPIAEVASWKTQYYLTVATDPSGLNPQPTLSPSGPWYDKDTQVTLTAQTVSAYYAFDQWKVDGTSRSAGVNPVTVSMNAAHTATAYYNQPPTTPSWALWLIGGLVAISTVVTSAMVVLVRMKKRYSNWAGNQQEKPEKLSIPCYSLQLSKKVCARIAPSSVFGRADN